MYSPDVYNPTDFIMLVDSYTDNAAYLNQFYVLDMNGSFLAHAKHKNRINIAFAASNVSPVLGLGEYGKLVDEMRELHGNPGDTTAIEFYDDALNIINSPF